METALNSLQVRNNILKSKLVHEQLKYGNYPFLDFSREISQLVIEYAKHNSIFKAASILGLNPYVVMKWFIQGQRGNPKFRSFYLRISYINRRLNGEVIPQIEEIIPEFKEHYDISHHGNAWCYTTYVDGEKVAIISGDLENLKKKVKSRELPLYE